MPSSVCGPRSASFGTFRIFLKTSKAMVQCILLYHHRSPQGYHATSQGYHVIITTYHVIGKLSHSIAITVFRSGSVRTRTFGTGSRCLGPDPVPHEYNRFLNCFLNLMSYGRIKIQIRKGILSGCFQRSNPDLIKIFQIHQS
jgi:hypothetical protein